MGGGEVLNRLWADGWQGRRPWQSPMLVRIHVFGDGMEGKESVEKMGELLTQEAIVPSAAVRAAVVAGKSGNADGAKGGRKANEL